MWFGDLPLALQTATDLFSLDHRLVLGQKSARDLNFWNVSRKALHLGLLEAQGTACSTTHLLISTSQGAVCRQVSPVLTSGAVLMTGRYLAFFLTVA